ncbi:hypothetical protein B0H13DRAFT_1618403, partial [Mycena leptocephala]
QKFDKAVATSFKTHIIGAYRWLAENYQDNDKICIFGFSRGAYSARAVRSIRGVYGLPDNSTQKETRDKAWLDLLSKWKVSGPSITSRSRSSSSWAAGPSDLLFLSDFIDFFLRDSVNSVGMMDNIKLAYTATNGIVRTFRHAVALDERRAKFKQNMWSHPKKPAVAANAQPNGDNGPSVVTDVQEVWFAGCHCDVGGGSVRNGTRPNLAHIPLRWMIRECFKARTGVLFSATKLAKLGIEPSSLYPDVRARPDVKAVIQGSQTIRVIEAPGWVPWAKSFLPTGSKHTPKTVLELTLPNMSEEELDARDAFAPLYDQLVIQSATWQAMESFFYTKKSVYDATADTFKDVLHQHNGAGRSIPPAESTHGGKIRVHRTVQMRMQGTYENGPDKGKQYIPKARMGWQQELEDKTPFEHVGADLIEWVS